MGAEINDSATRPARGHDCNQSATAGFAAALGHGLLIQMIAPDYCLMRLIGASVVALTTARTDSSELDSAQSVRECACARWAQHSHYAALQGTAVVLILN